MSRSLFRKGRLGIAVRMLRWGLAALLALGLLLDVVFPPQLPDGRGTSVMVVARDGMPLRAFADRDGVWRYPVTPEAVSPLYLQALIQYEDRWFWRHPGVNPVALLRSAGQWLEERRIVSGGSTLTMQVVRILDRGQTHTRTPWRKLTQMLRAVQLELHLSKREILMLYLQRAPFGGTIEGVEAASWAYLGKSAAQLSRAEAALLTVLPQAPSRLRPDRHARRAQLARDKVLQRMAERGVWTAAQVTDARIEPVATRRLQPPLVAALLAQRLHARHPRAERIVTTIDAGLQAALEQRVTDYFARLPERTSAALLVVDNATLQAQAYVGSVHFGDKARLGHVDMVQAWRSPGSTLKPFLYGMALDDGLIHSESLLVDAPQSFGDYRPGNFDAAFHGPVGAASALRLSLNVPAVDLLDRVGPERFATRLAHAGIGLRFPHGARPNLALILGGTGARLEDLVGAYAALNRGGIAGQVRYRPDDALVERRVLSPGAAWIVRSILDANPRPGELEAYDRGSRPVVAWKTGTSYGFRDAWALGSTRSHTVGVWVGRPDGTPLPGQYGAITALPLLFEVVDALPRRLGDAAARPSPASVSQVDICWPLGLAADALPSPLCARRHTAWVLDGVIPPTFAERGTRLWTAGRERFRVDATTGERITGVCSLPHAERQVELARWPVLVTPWLSAAERRAGELPMRAADCMDDGRDVMAGLHIDGVNDGAVLMRAPGGKPVQLRLSALGTRDPVTWLLNGRVAARTTTNTPAALTLDVPPGAYRVTALADTGAWASVGLTLADAARP